MKPKNSQCEICSKETKELFEHPGKPKLCCKDCFKKRGFPITKGWDKPVIRINK